MKFLDRFRSRPPAPAEPVVLAPAPVVLSPAEPDPVFVPTDTTHHEIIVDDAPGGLFVWTARVYHHDGPAVEKVGAGTSHAEAVTLAGAWANNEMERFA